MIKIIEKIKKIISTDKGFSLVEILVSIAISSMIMVMVHKTYQNIMAQVIKISGNAEFYEDLNLAMRRLDRDISSTLYIYRNPKIFFVGQNDTTDVSNSRLHFLTINKKTLNIIGSMKSFSPTCDIKEVSYYLKKDPEYDDLYFLIRKESLLYNNTSELKNEDDLEEAHKGIESVILKNVTELKFEFTRRKNWDDSWNSFRKNRFPKAVRTTIKLKNYNNQDAEFSIISMLEMVK